MCWQHICDTCFSQLHQNYALLHNFLLEGNGCRISYQIIKSITFSIYICVITVSIFFISWIVKMFDPNLLGHLARNKLSKILKYTISFFSQHYPLRINHSLETTNPKLSRGRSKSKKDLPTLPPGARDKVCNSRHYDENATRGGQRPWRSADKIAASA